MLNFLKKINLTRWIFIALFCGFFIGVFAPDLAHSLKPIRGLFLNGIKCIIAPLMFGSIVTGIANAGTPKQLGRIGLKALLYFELATTLALVVGLALVNVLKPGLGISLGAAAPADLPGVQTKLSFGIFIEHLLPTNIAEAVVHGDVLQIVIFSTLFGIALLLSGEKAKPVLDFCEGLAAIMFKFTSLIMYLAPLGVGAAMAASVADHGWQVIVPLFKLVGTLYFALFVFTLVVLIPALKYARVKVKPFLNELKPSLALAFATTASESAYPMTLNSLESMGVPRKISSFVLPLGYSFNLDGSTLYLSVASIFISQAAGVHLSLGTQLAMMLTLMLTTKGVAAVPRASLVVLSGTLTLFGLPLEGIALILGVDEFMDMARTMINLLGNCVATVVVAKWEGAELNPDYRA
jgi:proton glutamate symport protein